VQLAEAEAAFRVHKSGLQIRPYGITASLARAHSSRCVFWRTCCGRRRFASCRQGGLSDEPRRIFEELCEISLVDVILSTRNSVEVHKRCTSQPTEHQRMLLQRLGMRLPLWLKRAEM
jgi:hypothetical protein